jgi:transcription initiation factor TFIIE subunit alpha
MPKKDSRLMLARFNEQLQPLYDLLREVEGIKLAPEVLEPEPVDIDLIRGILKPNEHGASEVWSGEATRSSGFAVEETRVDITIGDADPADSAAPQKERPVWMTTSTVVGSNEAEEQNDAESLLEKVAQTSSQSNSAWPSAKTSSGRNKKDEENIMSVLLAHEKQTTKANTDAVKNLNTNPDSSGGDSSGDDDEIDRTEIRKLNFSEKKTKFLEFSRFTCKLLHNFTKNLLIPFFNKKSLFYYS